MIRPSCPAAPIRNGSRFFRRKPYVRRAPTRKNADSSLRFGPAPDLRRFSRGIRRKLGHPRNLRPPAFRHIRQPIAYLIVPVFEFHMFPVSSYETAPDGRDFIGSGPTGYATCGRKPQLADTEIPDANMLGARKLHNRHPTIGKTLPYRRFHFPFCPLYRKRTYRLVVPFRAAPKPVFQSEPCPIQAAYSGGSDVSTAGATSSPLRKSCGRRHGRPTAS